MSAGMRRTVGLVLLLATLGVAGCQSMVLALFSGGGVG